MRLYLLFVSLALASQRKRGRVMRPLMTTTTTTDQPGGDTKRRRIVVDLSIETNTMTVPATVEYDPCMIVYPASSCFGGAICSHLYWDSELRREIFSLHDVEASQTIIDIASNYPAVTCEEAHSGVEYVFREINFPAFQMHYDAMQRNVTELALPLASRFPFEPVAFDTHPLVEANRKMMALSHSFEWSMACRLVSAKGDFVSLKRLVESLSLAVVTLPPQSHREQFGILSNLISFTQSVGTHARTQQTPPSPTTVSRLGMISRVYPPRHLVAAPHTPSEWFDFASPPVPGAADGAGAVAILQALESVNQHAAAMLAARHQGNRYSIPDRDVFHQKVDVLKTFVRTVARNEELMRSNTESHLALLMFHFDRLICSQILAVVDIISSAQQQTAMFFMPTLLDLCKQKVPVSARIQTSSLIGRRLDSKRTPVVQRHVSGLPKELMIGESMDLLMDPFLDLSGEFNIVYTGNEQVGFIGQRKQWIDEIAAFMFTIDEKRPANAFEFTDATEVLITVRRRDIRPRADNSQLFAFHRAAGRLLGLALKYEIPISVPFARSFIKMLKLPSVVPRMEEHGGLLIDEDVNFHNSYVLNANADWITANPGIHNYDLLWLGFGEDAVVLPDQAVFYQQLRFAETMYFNRGVEMSYIRDGMTEVIGPAALHVISEEELIERLCPPAVPLTPDIVIQGMEFPRLDEANEAHVLARNLLLQVVAELSPEDIGFFNAFITGVNRRPLIAGPWIKVFVCNSLTDIHLPRSHTCHNELQLPLYTNLEGARAKILQAIRMGRTIEGHAEYHAVVVPAGGGHEV